VHWPLSVDRFQRIWVVYCFSFLAKPYSSRQMKVVCDVLNLSSPNYSVVCTQQTATLSHRRSPSRVAYSMKPCTVVGERILRLVTRGRTVTIVNKNSNQSQALKLVTFFFFITYASYKMHHLCLFVVTFC